VCCTAGYWDLQEQYGLPYALALGPYGSVLALTWQARGTPDAKTWVVMLGASPGAVSGWAAAYRFGLARNAISQCCM
jgi:hypothetical protein